MDFSGVESDLITYRVALGQWSPYSSAILAPLCVQTISKHLCLHFSSDSSSPSLRRGKQGDKFCFTGKNLVWETSWDHPKVSQNYSRTPLDIQELISKQEVMPTMGPCGAGTHQMMSAAAWPLRGTSQSVSIRKRRSPTSLCSPYVYHQGVGCDVSIS